MERPEVNKWLVTVAVMAPTLIEILDTSIANVALGHIQGSLSAGQDEATWVLTSYLVSNAVVIPISGWLARVMGRKNYLMASVIVFTLASMLCGMATSLGMLIVFRVLQGVGGGGLQPISQAILLETFPPRQRGMAMSIFGMGAVLAPILGPLLGGYITDNYSWRWIFYINVPIGALALVMIWTYIFDPDYLERRVAGEKVDVTGLALLTVGLACLQIVLDKGQQEDWFGSDFITLLAIVAGVGLAAFVAWEFRQKTPIVDLRIFKDRSFATGTVVMFLGYFAFFGSIVTLPLFLQNLMGYTAFLAGIVLGPGGLLMLIFLPVAGKLSQKVDARFLLLTGLIISAGSLFYMSGFTLGIDLGTAILGRNIQAVGVAFFFVPLNYLSMAYVPREGMTNASALFNLLRNLGGSCGVAFITTLLARRAQFHQTRLAESLSPFDPAYVQALAQLKGHLQYQLGAFADTTQAASAYIYGQLIRQATAMAFFDVFHFQAMLFVGLCAFMWIIRKPDHGKKVDVAAH